jgi:hypothetical protein
MRIPIFNAHSNDEAKRNAVERLSTSDKVVTVILRRAKTPICYSDSDSRPKNNGEVAEWSKAAVC